MKVNVIKMAVSFVRRKMGGKFLYKKKHFFPLYLTSNICEKIMCDRLFTCKQKKLT